MPEVHRPHLLLAKALRHLTDEEQAVVLSNLLPMTPWPGQRNWMAETTAMQAAQVLRPDEDDKVGFLVRLPVSTHSALKTWAESNGHSMNVIVRGLVEQFLDDQAAREP